MTDNNEGWISTRQKFPKDKTEVLVWVEWQSRIIGKRQHMAVAWYNSNFDYWENLSYVDMEVLFWQPLPSPPRTKE